ncbi:MAG: hypothetical protein Fur0025_30590 [Oscillatoriaceae cyanobacterium]
MNLHAADYSGKNILVVDDTPDNIRYLSTLLAAEGYTVRKALNGQKAIKACQATPPDLILLDIMMPEMDGYEVCQQLKSDELTCHIPVIFLSALDDVFDKVKAFEMGGADYVSKPFKADVVLIRIQNQLALQDAQHKIITMNADLEMRVKERTQQLEITNQELMQEISERQQLQQQLLHMALHDRLTGLPNRALFAERLEAAIKTAQQESDYRFAVLFMDCDRFKVINDSLGHSVGDELLVAIARRIKTILQERDTLARLGGDEFAILLENISDIDAATKIADRILRDLAVPFQLSRYEVFINASIGITLGDRECDKPEYLLRDADTAMYRAKAMGKGGYRVFTPAMHQEALQVLQLENDLRRAIERQEFIVHYQPIIALDRGTIAGFEALVRWQHPHHGFISPAAFIPVAEETGLVADIDILVLRQACRQLRLWQQDKLTDETIAISVNLSARHFSQNKIIDEIDNILAETNLCPGHLKMEITESALIENGASAQKIINQIRSRQIEISLDDFGTGYSSLSYLNSFPVNNLKIDQSFMKQLDGSQKVGLIPAIIGIARTMGMRAIAEGVETKAQLDLLKDLKCDCAQGYLFSKPLDGQLAGNLLASTPHW